MSGRPVFPGAAYFELAGAAAGMLASAGRSDGSAAAEAALAGVSIVAPLLLPPLADFSSSDALMLQASYSAATGSVAVASLRGGSRSKPTKHVTASVAFVASQRLPNRQPAAFALQPRRLGLGRQLLATTLQQRGAAAVAALAPAAHDDSAVTISPAALDCCLQLAAVPAAGAAKLRIPAGVGLLLPCGRAEARRAGKSSSEHAAVARPSADSAPAGSDDATFTDYRLVGSGNSLAVCSISEMEARPMGSTAPPRAWAARRHVAVAAAPPSKLEQGDWLYSLEWLTHASSDSKAAAAGEEAAAGGVKLALTGGAWSAAAGAIAVGQQAVASRLQSLALVTRGAQPAAAAGHSFTADAVPAAGLWAFARTVAQELTFNVQAIDVQHQAAGSHSCAALLAAPAGEAPTLLPPDAQLGGSAYGHAVQGGGLVAAALQRSAVKPMLPAFQLFPQPRGALQSLAPIPVQTTTVAPGQVLVAVRAVGINFRWV